MIKNFKFFNENKYNIEDDPLYHLNVYENIVLGVIGYCYRMNLTPVGYRHHFYMGEEIKHMKITDLITHNNFESRHVRINYDVYDINNLTNHNLHLSEDVFIEAMRRYEHI